MVERKDQGSRIQDPELAAARRAYHAGEIRPGLVDRIYQALPRKPDGTVDFSKALTPELVEELHIDDKI